MLRWRQTEIHSSDYPRFAGCYTHLFIERDQVSDTLGRENQGRVTHPQQASLAKLVVEQETSYDTFAVTRRACEGRKSWATSARPAELGVAAVVVFPSAQVLREATVGWKKKKKKKKKEKKEKKKNNVS